MQRNLTLKDIFEKAQDIVFLTPQIKDWISGRLDKWVLETIEYGVKPRLIFWDGESDFTIGVRGEEGKLLVSLIELDEE